MNVQFIELSATIGHRCPPSQSCLEAHKVFIYPDLLDMFNRMVTEDLLHLGHYCQESYCSQVFLSAGTLIYFELNKSYIPRCCLYWLASGGLKNLMADRALITTDESVSNGCAIHGLNYETC